MTKQMDLTKTFYWLATGLFLLMFIVSIALSLFDWDGTITEYKHLEFPGWLNIPLITAKALGVLAIASNKSQTLKDFAFAGFLFDLLLALGAHIAQMEIKVLLPIIGLVLWVSAFYMDRKVHPVAI